MEAAIVFCVRLLMVEEAGVCRSQLWQSMQTLTLRNPGASCGQQAVSRSDLLCWKQQTTFGKRSSAPPSGDSHKGCQAKPILIPVFADRSSLQLVTSSPRPNCQWKNRRTPSSHLNLQTQLCRVWQRDHQERCAKNRSLGGVCTWRVW